MANLTSLRIFSILITALIALIFNHTHFMLILTILGLSHYAMAFLYSRSIAWKLVSKPQTAIPFFILIGLTVAITSTGWPPIFFLFGFHHIVSELYTPGGIHTSLTTKNPKVFSSEIPYLQGIFHTFCYILLAKDLLTLEIFHSVWPLWGLLLVSVWYFSKLSETNLSMSVKSDFIGGEVLFLVVSLISYFSTIGFEKVLFYHFTLWAVFPLFKLCLSGRGAVLKYLAWTGVATVLIVIGLSYELAWQLPWHLTHLAGKPPSGSLSQLARQGFTYLTLVGFIHITLSLGLSRQNPYLIRRWFYPETK